MLQQIHLNTKDGANDCRPFRLTSLKFNTLETLIEAIGLPKCKSLYALF